MNYTYLCNEIGKEECLSFVKNKLNPTQKDVCYSDVENYKINWRERHVKNTLNLMRANDNLIVFDGASVALSTSQVCEIMMLASQKQINLYFVKYDMHITPNKVDTCYLIRLIGFVESDFVSARTKFALNRRREAGLPLGRPKGRGNKSLKLDKHKEEIEKYLKLGISGASIAKLIGCHPQTFYDWIDRSKARKAS